MENKRKALGKGLEELFNSENLELEKLEQSIMETASKDEIIEINLKELRPNPYQPRKIFDSESLQELADSIKQYGVFQPIIVKKSIRGYEIIAGERRVKAASIAGLLTIPAIVRDFSDEQMMQIALLENLQRKDLSAIEEANAYNQIIEALQITQEDLSKKIGKSRSHVTNMLGLLKLPNEVQDMILNGNLTMGHARVLSKLENKEQINQLANRVIKEGISVRELEKLVNINYERKIKIKTNEKNSEIKYIENVMSEKLGSKVDITKSKISISYDSINDLNRILEIINIKIDD
ncbi:MAG: ParB/RepB/Spo0J family partition protein [Bacilli bacterium]|nr:ParB/RepB/Spo0J family partition protein [Bacilli bacterium]